jgi:hypothetical protein
MLQKPVNQHTLASSAVRASAVLLRLERVDDTW